MASMDLWDLAKDYLYNSLQKSNELWMIFLEIVEIY